MVNTLAQNLSSIFSVLPDEQPEEVSREVLQHFLSRDSPLTAVLKWAEFDQNGRFLRGGATSMSDLSTRLFADPSADPDIRALADNGPSGIARPGRIIAQPSGASCHWFVPIIPQGPSRTMGQRIKALAIGEALLAELFALFDPAAGVTPAENRLLFQLLRGNSLREAAAEDTVSFETKRAQAKSVCAKLGCRGQNDLIRAIMGQLPHLLSIAEAAGHDEGAIERFARGHLGPDVRLVLHRLPTGHLLRTFECGPADGTPLLVAHGMMYPLLLLNCSRACHEHGIRLIMPVRNGYLDDQPATALYSFNNPETNFADVAGFISHNLGAPVALAGHSLGAAWAIAFVRRYPHLVTQLLLLSPHFASGTPENSRFFGPFLRGLGALAHRPGLYRYVAWRFRRHFVDAVTVRRVLRRLFEASSDDVRVIEGHVGSGPAYDWFASAYRSSIVGIADDMAAGVWPEKASAQIGPMPITIVRGPADPVAGHGIPAELGESSGRIRCKQLASGGHLIAASHSSEMWRVVAEVLQWSCISPPNRSATSG